MLPQPVSLGGGGLKKHIQCCFISLYIIVLREKSDSAKRDLNRSKLQNAKFKNSDWSKFS